MLESRLRGAPHDAVVLPVRGAGARLFSPVPPPILWLYAGNLALALLFAVDSLLGSPSYQLSEWIDLDGEQNIPTWYASMQWFSAGALLGLFAARFPDERPARRWMLAALPLVFVAMSLDEVAGIHEWLGVQSDALLADGDRKASLFSANGIWVLVIGLPFVVLLGLLLYSLREFFRMAPAGFYKIVIGLGIAFLGALGFEMLLNFIPRYGPAETMSELIEETLEMMGATTVVWGAYVLAASRNPR